MTSNTPSAHPMLEPLDYKMTPEIAAATLQGDLLRVYELLWSAAVATAMDGPALRQQLLEIRLQLQGDPPGSIPDLVLHAVREVCIDPGWRALLPQEGALKESPISPFLAPYPPSLQCSVDALPPGLRGSGGTRQHDALACAGLGTSFAQAGQWQISRVNLTSPLSVDQLLDEMAEHKVGRPSTFASSLQLALGNKLVSAESDGLEVGEYGRSILDDIALHSPRSVPDAAYSNDLETALKAVEANQGQAGRVLNTFCDRALGQSTALADWLDELVIEGESLTQALARADGRLPGADSWDMATLPSGLTPRLLTRSPQEAIALRESIDGLLAQVERSHWKRFTPRERAACRVKALQLCEAHSTQNWPLLVCRDIAWRWWVDLGPQEPPFTDEDLSAAQQYVDTLPEDVRLHLTEKVQAVQSFI